MHGRCSRYEALSVFSDIRGFGDPHHPTLGLLGALFVAQRIKSRQLYPFVAEALLPSTTPKLSQEELDGIKRRISELTGNKVAHVNLILHRVTLNYGW